MACEIIKDHVKLTNHEAKFAISQLDPYFHRSLSVSEVRSDRSTIEMMRRVH